MGNHHQKIGNITVNHQDRKSSLELLREIMMMMISDDDDDDVHDFRS
jgi:hypothetical protein